MMINRTLYCNVDKFYDEILMHDWWFSIYAASFGLIHHEKVKLLCIDSILDKVLVQSMLVELNT